MNDNKATYLKRTEHDYACDLEVALQTGDSINRKAYEEACSLKNNK